MITTKDVDFNKVIKDIEINTELKELIPPLNWQEKENLEKSILEEGCRDSLVFWNKTLIDGHNRFEICCKHKIPFSIANVDFKDIEEVKQWMYRNQLGRRNLTDKQRDDLIGRIYKQEKIVDKFKGNQHTKSGGVQNEPYQNTAEKIGEEYGVGQSTVKRNEEFSDSLDTMRKSVEPKIVNKILTNEIPMTKKDTNELAREEPEIQKKVMDLIDKGKAKKVDEAKEQLGISPKERDKRRKIFKEMDEEYERANVILNLINSMKFRGIEEQHIKDYLNNYHSLKGDLVKNCDNVIEKLEQIKKIYQDESSIRREK